MGTPLKHLFQFVATSVKTAGIDCASPKQSESVRKPRDVTSETPETTWEYHFCMVPSTTVKKAVESDWSWGLYIVIHFCSHKTLADIELSWNQEYLTDVWLLSTTPLMCSYLQHSSEFISHYSEFPDVIRRPKPWKWLRSLPIIHEPRKLIFPGNCGHDLDDMHLN